MHDLYEFILQQAKSNQFLSGGLVIGVLSGIVMSMRSIPGKLWSRIKRKLMFEVTIEQGDDLYPWVQNYLNAKHGNELRRVKASYWKVAQSYVSLAPESIHSSDKKIHSIPNQITYNHYGDDFYVWHNRRLIKISSQKEKMEHASNYSSMFFEKFYISSLAGKNAIQSLLLEISTINLQMEKEKTNPRIYGHSYRDWQMERGVRLRNINSVFIEPSIKKDILSDIQNFIDSESFCYDKNIPYRRGYLLYGPPGTGKSSLVSALANHFKRNLYVLNLKSCENDDALDGLIRQVERGSVLLFEDIDRYFSKDQVEDAKTKISYSSFINALSGVKAKEDVILIVTTNHKSKLDEALLRSGRLDRHFEIGKPSLEEICNYLAWFYDQDFEMIDIPSNLCMADVENSCVRNKHDKSKAVEELRAMSDSGGITVPAFKSIKI